MASKTWVPGTVIDSPWLQDVNDSVYGPTAPATTLRGQLASTASAPLGAGLSGFDWANVYANGTVGGTLRMVAGTYNVLRHITPSLWEGILNGTTTTDVSVQVQAAHDALLALGGGSLLIPGTVLCNTPIKIMQGVDLVGVGRNVSKIKKDSTTSKAVTIVAGALTVYGATLPSNINAILVLDGPGGRYTGNVRDISFEGTYTTALNYESQKVEFGIVSTGSLSDCNIERCTITAVQYAIMLPVVFASCIRNNRMNECLRGLSINNGTSCTITANYANNCRDWGIWANDLKYSKIDSNACDSLNDPTKYPTRTRTCSAYKWTSLLGCDITNNGDEQTWGRSHFMDTFDHSTLANNVTIGLGGDYVGVDQIAWLYSTAVSRNSRVIKNMAYDVKPTGLTSGGASAANFHNLYIEGLTFIQETPWDDNVARANRNGNLAESGWGNNVNALALSASTWTPTITQGVAVTCTVSNAEYRFSNGVCNLRAKLAVTGAGTGGGVSIVIGGIPSVLAMKSTISTNNIPVGTFQVNDVSATKWYAGTIQTLTPTTFQFQSNDVASALGITPLFALAAGDSIYFEANFAIVGV